MPPGAKRKRSAREEVLKTDMLAYLLVTPKEKKSFTSALQVWYEDYVSLDDVQFCNAEDPQAAGRGRVALRNGKGSDLIDIDDIFLSDAAAVCGSRVFEVAYAKLRTSVPPICNPTGTFVFVEDAVRALWALPALTTVVGSYWSHPSIAEKVIASQAAHFANVGRFGLLLEKRDHPDGRTALPVFVKGSASRRHGVDRIVQPTKTSQPMLEPAQSVDDCDKAWPSGAGLCRGQTLAVTRRLTPPSIEELLSEIGKYGQGTFQSDDGVSREGANVALGSGLWDNMHTFWECPRKSKSTTDATREPDRDDKQEAAAEAPKTIPAEDGTAQLSRELQVCLPTKFWDSVTGFDRGLLTAALACGIGPAAIHSAVSGAASLLPPCANFDGAEGNQLILRTTVLRLLSEKKEPPSARHHDKRRPVAAAGRGTPRRRPRPWPSDLAVGYDYKRAMSQLLEALRRLSPNFDYNEEHFQVFRAHAASHGSDNVLTACTAETTKFSDAVSAWAHVSQKLSAPPIAAHGYGGPTLVPQGYGAPAPSTPVSRGYGDVKVVSRGYGAYSTVSPSYGAVPPPVFPVSQVAVQERADNETELPNRQPHTPPYVPSSPTYSPSSPSYSPSSSTYRPPSPSYGPPPSPKINGDDGLLAACTPMTPPEDSA